MKFNKNIFFTLIMLSFANAIVHASDVATPTAPASTVSSHAIYANQPSAELFRPMIGGKDGTWTLPSQIQTLRSRMTDLEARVTTLEGKKRKKTSKRMDQIRRDIQQTDQRNNQLTTNIK